jgi:hypothetical protein
MVFCNATPATPMVCNFMYELHLKVCAHNVENQLVAPVLQLSYLKSHLEGEMVFSRRPSTSSLCCRFRDAWRPRARPQTSSRSCTECAAACSRRS